MPALKVRLVVVDAAKAFDIERVIVTVDAFKLIVLYVEPDVPNCVQVIA